MPPKVKAKDITTKSFRKEISELVINKCHEINHYISGVDSPLSYLQIADIQEHLCQIEEILKC